MTHAVTQALISIGGIALTIGLAWLLGFRNNPVLASAAEAERIAAQALHGFRPVGATLTPNRRGARVTGTDGRVAEIAPMGDRWVVRLAV